MKNNTLKIYYLKKKKFNLNTLNYKKNYLLLLNNINFNRIITLEFINRLKLINFINKKNFKNKKIFINYNYKLKLILNKMKRHLKKKKLKNYFLKKKNNKLNLYLRIKKYKKIKKMKLKVKKFHVFKKDWFYYIYLYLYIIKINLINKLISKKLLINIKLILKNILKLKILKYFIIILELYKNKELKIYKKKLINYLKSIQIDLVYIKAYILIIFKHIKIKYTKSLFFNKYRRFYNRFYNPLFKKKLNINKVYKYISKPKYFIRKKLKKNIRFKNFKYKQKKDLKLKKKNLFFYINRTKNNLFITIVKNKKILFKLSIGLLKIKNFKKILKYTYEQIGLELNSKFKEKFNFKYINFIIIINGYYSRLIKKIIYNFINLNRNTGYIYKIKGIRDYSPRVHNGCRLKKKRR